MSLFATSRCFDYKALNLKIHIICYTEQQWIFCCLESFVQSAVAVLETAAYLVSRFTMCSVMWIAHHHVLAAVDTTKNVINLCDKLTVSARPPGEISITAFTTAHNLSLSWTRSIQSMTPSPSHFFISILIVSFHIRLGLSSGLLSSLFPVKTLHWLLPSL